MPGKSGRQYAYAHSHRALRWIGDKRAPTASLTRLRSLSSSASSQQADTVAPRLQGLEGEPNGAARGAPRGAGAEDALDALSRRLGPAQSVSGAVRPAHRDRGAPQPPVSGAGRAKVSTPRHVAMSCIEEPQLSITLIGVTSLCVSADYPPLRSASGTMACIMFNSDPTALYWHDIA